MNLFPVVFFCLFGSLWVIPQTDTPLRVEFLTSGQGYVLQETSHTIRNLRHKVWFTTGFTHLHLDHTGRIYPTINYLEICVSYLILETKPSSCLLGVLWWGVLGMRV